MTEKHTSSFETLAAAIKRARHDLSHTSSCVVRYQRSHQGVVFARLIIPTQVSWTRDGLQVELGMSGRPGNPFLLPRARMLESDLIEQAIERIDAIVNWACEDSVEDHGGMKYAWKSQRGPVLG